MAADQPVDPVIVARARAARAAKWGQRLGYLLYLFSLLVFVFGLVNGFNTVVARIVIVAVIVGSVLLAPAIILDYAVKAAIRHDRTHHQAD
ncbi:MAG: hypothetical protein KTU85_01380 [Acidimicrobiia bacterium]|nr:hypothetical protein [Acidimicrobiia bacterium]MCY4456690.1 hypothetical protein [Acidimicrobiaceae bacterium]